MSTTRKKIREQVQLQYNQYVDKNGFNDEIDVRLIDIMVEQSINKFLKVQVFQNLKAGNIEIPTCNIIQYTLSPVSNSVTLPVIPLQLPMDMGVWRVSLSSGGDPFIPINSTMSNVYGTSNVGFLEGRIGYVLKSNKIFFTNPVTTSVAVELIVSDFATTGESDLLPITPELEADIISDVLERISQGRISQPQLNVNQNAN